MDYKEILDLILRREYIDPKFFNGLSSYFFPNEINRLYDEINSLVKRNDNRILEIFDKLTELDLYKSVIELKISSAIVSDAKDNDNKYVQARVAILNKEKKRVWISLYLAPLSEFRLKRDGKLDSEEIKARGREKILEKALSRLKSEYGFN
jgi:hypothetical protein